MHVLQVEDDKTTARAVELMLRSEGYDCETTAFGEDAVRLAKENDYDLILLDIMLPDIDGYEVLKRLQELNVQSPVLIQSGLVREDQDRAALGVANCLVKPFNKQELKRRIDDVIRHQPAAGEKATAGGEEGSVDERRRAPRARIIKSGEIVYDGRKCVMDCLILSLSEGGAAIQPQDMLNFPERFQLRLKFGPTHDCRVCWQHGNKLGVRFLNQ